METTTEAPALPEGVTPAPSNWGQLTDFGRWLVDHFGLADAFDHALAADAPARGPSRKPETAAEIIERKRGAASGFVPSVTITAVHLWRVLADEQAALDLARILFQKEGGEITDEERRGISIGALAEGFYTLKSVAEHLRNGLLGDAPTSV